MNRIKVAHIITMLELGGAQDNTLYTVDNLDMNRFEPILICGPGGILDEKAKKLSVKLYFVKHLVRQINPLYDLCAFFKLIYILNIEKPDIVHTHSSKAGILGRWAAYLAGIKTIIHTFHGFGFNKYQKYFTQKVFISAEWLTGKITDKLIAVAKENINTMLKYKIGKPDKYLLIRSGIKIGNFTDIKVDLNLKKEEFKINLGEKVVTTIGPLKPQKNLIDFVKLAEMILKKINNVKFIIVGDGRQRKEIECHMRKLKLEDGILLPGWRKDIPEILAITDVFVMTSLWEGLPRVIIEAMCSGKPVVANAVDGVKEIVVDNVTGFLVEPEDLENMSEKVILLLKDSNLAQNFGKTARERIDKSFDIDFMVRQQEELYIYCDTCGFC